MSTEIDAARLRKARWGVSLLFLGNGAMWANLVPRLPDIRERLDVGYGAFGIAVSFASIGAIALGLLAATLIRRFGSARVAAATLALQAVAVSGAGLAPSVILFGLFLFMNGALDSITDVAQNAHGLIVQKRMKRSIINGLHAMWSAGAAIGAFLGQTAVTLDLDITVHLGIAVVAFAGLALIAKRLMLPDDSARPVEEEQAAEDSAPRPRRVGIPAAAAVALGMLGLVSIAGAAVEDAGFTWSSNYMADEVGAPKSVIGYALVGLMALHFVGRITGDRLVDRFGERAVVRVGGLVTMLGMGAALAWPSVWGTILGFSLAGLGVATTVPIAFAASDNIPGLRHGTGVTITSWLLRISFLVGPPLVGAVADATSLRAGLLVVPLCGLAVVLLAGSLSGRHEPADAMQPRPIA
mgnify:CR=1 FL=1|jgi:fucose permease